MVKCEKCGQEFIKEKQLEHLQKKLVNQKVELLCANCKKVAIAEKLMDVYKDLPSGRRK